MSATIFIALVSSKTLVGQTPLAELLTKIKSVGKDGVGNEQAAAAMVELNRAQASRIPQLLASMNGASPIQQNWIMGIINQAANRGELPTSQIDSFFQDRDNDSTGRLIAFELLTSNKPKLKQALVPTLIDDPSRPLRYQAIAKLIDQASALKTEDSNAAVRLLNQALDNALNVSQLQSITKKLRAEGQTVNFQKVMGFLNRWQIVGSFDNTESQGFEVAYGPELNVAQISLDANYQTKNGKSVTWQTSTTQDNAGVVDLNQLIGKQKDRSAYATTVFRSPAAGPAEIRVGTPNATKVWLNGELVLVNEIYHNSNSIDKFIGSVDLKQGENVLLIKVCQNNQTQPWAQDWKFQIRICGPDSKPILDTSLYQPAEQSSDDDLPKKVKQ